MKLELPDHLDEAYTQATSCASIGQLEYEIRFLLIWLHDVVKPNYTVEIGTNMGGMAYVLDAVTTEKTVTIDTHRLVNPAVQNLNILYVLKNSQRPETGIHVTQALGGPIDFLFIDGDHSEEGVKSDYRIWRPRVRSGGWIGLHDINNDSCPGVRKLWESIQGEKIEIVQTPYHNNVHGYSGQIGCGGIGVVKKP
jgi:cephalosporin hydroxylase